ncbi:MAG: transcriptional repressor LexA [bacterium]|nr:transcriptional repressor LexA [bacterium]
MQWQQLEQLVKLPLTAKQRQIFDYIEGEITDRGHAPTIREIGLRFGITSTNGVRTHLTALIKKGYVKKQQFISRGLELSRPIANQIGRMPLVGRVAAGSPIDAIENIEKDLAFDLSFVPKGESFALRVNGDSMKNAGILDGDIVLVKKQAVAQRGDIIVARINNEATVKRYQPEGDKILLMPENDAFEPIVVSKRSGEFRIEGKVVGLVRRMG